MEHFPRYRIHTPIGSLVVSVWGSGVGIWGLLELEGVVGGEDRLAVDRDACRGLVKQQVMVVYSSLVYPKPRTYLAYIPRDSYMPRARLVYLDLDHHGNRPAVDRDACRGL